MSGTMRAQFQLDLVDGLTGPIERIERVIGGLQQALERVARAVNPFEELGEPIPRATEAIDQLNEAISQTTRATEGAAEATGGLNEALEATGTAASGAAEAVGRIGREAQESVGQAVSAIERMQGALRGVGGGSGAGHGGRHSGGLLGASQNFTHSVHGAIGSAFGAAALGFGLIEPVHAASEYQNTLTHIGIGLGMQGDANVAFAARFGTQLDTLARQNGQRGTDLAEAAGYLSREGYRGDQLNAVLPVIAQISTAYNAHPDGVAKTTFTLQENLGVGNRDLGGSLAALATAGKLADVPFESLASMFPEAAAMAGSLGVRGRSGVDDLAATLAVVRRSVGTDGQAITNTKAFLQAIGSHTTARNFAKYGVDLFGVEDNANNAGLDPMLAVLQQVNRITGGGRDRNALGTLFHNQEDRQFVQAMLGHMDEYSRFRGRIAGVDQTAIQHDYRTARSNSDLTALNAFEETLAQIERRVGHGLVPVLQVATTGLNHLIDGWDRLDAAFPKLTPIVLATAGGVLAFVTALTALGAVAGPVVAGVGLLGAALGAVLSPVGLAVGAIALVGVGTYELIHHFDAVGAALTAAGTDAAHFVEAVPHAISAMWHALLSELAHPWQGSAGSSGPPRAVPIPGAAHMGAPLEIHVAADAGLRVTARPHPAVRVVSKPAPGTGRTVMRP